MTADERWVVSPFARVSWRDGRAELVSGSGAGLASADPRLVTLLHAFAEPRTAAEAAAVAGEDPERIAAAVRSLVRVGVLLPAGTPDPAAAHFWEPAALADHRAARAPGFVKAPATSLPPVAPRRSATTLPLDPWPADPPAPAADPGDPPAPAGPGARPERAGRPRELPELLAGRRSRRVWGDGPLPRRALADLLWLAARNLTTPADPLDPAGLVRRPYPSGGAAYSLEVHPVLGPGAVEGVPAGVHRYLPEAHALEELAGEAAAQPVLAAAAAAANSAPPPVVLVLTSRYARTAEWYGRLAYGLVLKEVGALMQTVYLACEHLGLAACALGTGTPPLGDELAEPVVGEIMVGPRALT